MSTPRTVLPSLNRHTPGRRPHEVDSGARLGAFEILAPLGAGGMGEVYRARDTRLDRTVAIKLLPSEVVNAPGRGVERLRHEARAIARITHPNICTLHDVGEDGSAIFLVMEYVDGATLAQRLEDGPFPLPLVLRTAIGIADALDHAHRNDVVHRDLKPSNIMLTRHSVKLLDFGLAKLKERDEQVPADATSALTDAGTIVGTVPYMAPEQIDGHEVDARTDIFSFGVVLYEMVCGRRPFAGDSRGSLMAAIMAAEPPSLLSVEPQTPVSLEREFRDSRTLPSVEMSCRTTQSGALYTACQAPGDASERDLGWLVASLASGLSSDGRTLIFSDGLSGRTLSGNATVFRRSTVGSPAISLGEARSGGPLSSDGRWVLAEREGNLILRQWFANSTLR